MSPMWYVVAQDGTRVEGPFYSRDAALMALTTHPTCRVVREETA